MTATWIILIGTFLFTVIGLVVVWLDYKFRPVEIREVRGPCPCPDCPWPPNRVASDAGHHMVMVTAPGTGKQVVARPLRDTSWWHQRKQERACAEAYGHCWHAGNFIDWWCCMCSGEVDGMPDQRCTFCVAQP